MPQYTEEQKQHWAENRQKNLDFATETLQKGVESVFQSEEYRNYLEVMSRFPRYSVNNTILIAMQRPDASHVCSYGQWKKFGRSVKKGAHGIKIYAPTPYTTTIDQEMRDPITRETVMDADGAPVREQVEVRRVAFKVVNVFDLSDTEGKELPELGVHQLTGEVEEYDRFMEALMRTAQIPVSFETIESEANGYFNRADNTIVLREGMSQQQTIKTAIHEISHSRLHSIDAENGQNVSDLPDKNTREVQAESVAFVVCSRYGIDTSDYSFPYISSWSDGRETPELKASLQVIRETASTLIDEIDQHLEEIHKEQEQTLAPAEQEAAAYILENGNVLTVHLSDDGWDFSLYDPTLLLLDGGCYTGPQNVEEAKDEALKGFGLEEMSTVTADFSEMRNQIDRAEETGLPPVVFPYLDKEGGKITCDTAVEPVVTVKHSDLPQLRDGMQLPLHIANKLFAQMEKQQAEQTGHKAERENCPVTAFQIDYRSDDKSARYSGHFYAGSGNGGLLLHMERAANRRLSYLQQHPEQGSMDTCREITERLIPMLYQQAMTAENRILNETLPEPAPFYNVSPTEAVDNSDIGSKAYYASHRETVRCARSMDAGLGSAYHHRALYQFMRRMNREFGVDRVKTVLARTVQIKDYDGRFRTDNKQYAASVPILIASHNREDDITHSYELNAHPLIVDTALSVFRKMEQSQERKPSIRDRLEKSRTEQKTQSTQRENTQKRSTSHEL